MTETKVNKSELKKSQMYKENRGNQGKWWQSEIWKTRMYLIGRKIKANYSKGKSMYKDTGVKQHSAFSLEEWKFKWILWEMILRRQTGIRSGKILSMYAIIISTYL